MAISESTQLNTCDNMVINFELHVMVIEQSGINLIAPKIQNVRL